MISPKRLHTYIIFLFISLLIYSCGATSTVRYDRGEEKEKKEKEEKTYKETFDMTPYKTTIDIKESPVKPENDSDLEIWYGYEPKDTTADTVQTVVHTANGFRVQVFTTDNLDEADSLKAVLIPKLTRENIYIIFDPPFYKVEAGDFTTMNEAKDLNFKLTQMGFTESRVISSTVNISE